MKKYLPIETQEDDVKRYHEMEISPISPIKNRRAINRNPEGS